MTMTYATITGRITAPGSDVGIRVKLTATPKTSNGTLRFPADDRITVGPEIAETDDSGDLPDIGESGAFTIPLNSTLGDDVVWEIVAETLERYPGIPVKWTVARTPITGDVTIDDIVNTDLMMVTSALYQSIVDMAAAVEAVGATHDAQTAENIEIGPLTGAALLDATARTQLRSPLLVDDVLGGNITLKTGQDWPQFWADWDWDYWIKPQVDRAVEDGLNGIRLIGAPHAPLVAPPFAAWSQSATFALPDIIRRVGTHLYVLVTAGTTASSGTGPSGTGTGITDGTCVWDYDGEAPAAITQDEYDAQWEQLAQYCTSKGLALYPALCDMRAFNAVSSGDFTNSTVVDSLCSTAAALAQYGCVIGFDVFQEGDGLAGRAWSQSRAYTTGDRVYTTAGRGYIATTGGTSAGSGTGPSGTGTGITDGTVVWDYDHEVLMPSDVLSVYASLRAAVGRIPLTTSIAVTSSSFPSDDRDAWHTILHTSADGSDFIDLHLYPDTDLDPRVLDYLAHRTGKQFLIGEFGANQSLTSDEQLARFTRVKPIYERPGVRGGFVWALADQGLHNPAKQTGTWDLTGYVRGVSPLSTTSGRRTALTDALATFRRSSSPGHYAPPNMLTPERARPVRSLSTLPGQSIGYWSVGANTARVADPRGIGFKCVAGGAVTTAFVGAQSVDPLIVTENLAYVFWVELLSQVAGRDVLVWIDFFDASFVQLASSSFVPSSDDPGSPTGVAVVADAPPTAKYAQPTVQWSADQATNEVHMIREAWFGLG